ncbi:GNAT family N-acetyltransferase [Streptomyces sp. SM14]|uniref:GNAT family N-acetyltransferase n=1 Tax=Streptomyces sp. SM14 TaxID=1736045 RepID=UPI000CD4CD71|nr:GNAT family N-acetyltransferase [Streptomyces sp. SM14]
MDLQMRSSTDGTLDPEAWLHAVHLGFLNGYRLPEGQLTAMLEHSDLSRIRGVFDGETCVATFRSFDQRLTVPGGTDVPAHAVTGVTVTASHRRRGLLRRMIATDLAAAKEGGETLSTLVAAEARIYGRFGYGPATISCTMEVDGLRAGLDSSRPAVESGSVVFTDGAEVRKVGPELHERFRLRQPGAVDRAALWWRNATGDVQRPPGWEEPFHLLYRDADGVVQGLADFTSDHRWTRGVPDGTATVHSLIAATPDAERALWHFILSLDWVVRISAERQGPDALLPDLVPEPRAVRATAAQDFLWLRPLDVPTMLAARGYGGEGELVLEVTDPMGLTAGRFALTASAEGARCVPTTRSADLTLGSGALGTLYLGDRSASRLALLGLVDEERPGALALADRLLHTPMRPWTADVF